jgi:hypothetical protein
MRKGSCGHVLLICASSEIAAGVPSPGTARAEFTRRGSLACDSLEHYRELEYDTFAAAFESTMQKHTCTVLTENMPPGREPQGSMRGRG